MNDAIAYMAWERVVPWKILSMMARPKEPLVPVGFGARNRDFLELLEPGSRIWVVTRIASQFSLAARVRVQAVLDRGCLSREAWPKDLAGLLAQWQYVARADPSSSEFIETNNAAPAMAQHGVRRFSQARTIEYREGQLGDAFAPCIAQARQTVFLSYRWKEGRRFAVALARELRELGLSPWLDALSVPGYEAKREPGVNAPRLEKLIKLGIERSQWAAVINTKTYARASRADARRRGKQSWTRIELSHIRRKKVPWFQVMRGGRRLSGDEPPIPGESPKTVVREMLRRRSGC